MSTAFGGLSPVTFSEIHHGIGMIEIPQEVMEVQHSLAERLAQVLAIYRGLRPLLIAVVAIPLIPNQWRAAMQAFVVAVDALAAVNASGDFKAGKDL